MHFILEKHAFFLFFNIFGIVSKNVSKGGLSDNLIRLSESLGNLSWWWGRVSCSSLVAQDHSPGAAPSLSSLEEQSPWAPQPTAGSPCSRLSLHSQLWAYAEQALANICLQDNKPAANTSPNFAWQVGLTATMAGTWHRGGINGHGGGNGTSGLTSLTASPAPSSCPCVLGKHHSLSCSALRNAPSWKQVASSQKKWLICILLLISTGVFPFMFCPFREAKLPCFWRGKANLFPVSLFYVAVPTSSQVNYYLTYLIIES